MLFFQHTIAHLRATSLTFVLSIIPLSVGYSAPHTALALRTTHDSTLTPSIEPQASQPPMALKPSLDSTHELRKGFSREKRRHPLAISLTPGVTPPKGPEDNSASSHSTVRDLQEASPEFFLQGVLYDYTENNGEDLPKLPQKERLALYAFYDIGGYKLLWATKNGWSPKAQELIAILKDASKEGLRAGDYKVPLLNPGTSSEDIARADVVFSTALIRYARDAQGARFQNMGISPQRASPDRTLPSVYEVLSSLQNSANAEQTLINYNPTTLPLYRELKQALAKVRSASLRKIEEPLCTPPSKDKKKCRIKSPKHSSESRRAEGKILANMERLRWLPPDLGPFYVMVNIPTFNATIMDNHSPVRTSRVIVGKQRTQTPLVSSRISSVVVNPTWFVPASIAREIMPNVGRHSQIRGYRVRWSKQGLLISQPPGERNALGRLKLIFETPYGIYMHDTPSRHLFASGTRAFSHGCIRLDDPVQFAASLLAYSTSINRETSYGKLSKLIATKRESSIFFPKQIPIYVTYITIKVDGGDVVLLQDIYGYDNIMIPRLLSS